MTCLLIFVIVKTWLNLTFIIRITICFTKNLNYIYTKIITTIFYNLKKLIYYNITYDSKKILGF